MLRIHQTSGLHARDGFAHHGAADAKAAYQLGFCGQFVAGLHFARLDPDGKTFHQIVRQASRSSPGLHRKHR
jgi:hypothetical protein